MKSIYIYLLVCLVTFSSCKNEGKQVSNPDDYNVYLQTSENTSQMAMQKEYAFWNSKLEKAPNQFLYLAKMAAANSQLFSQTGEISYLIKAEANLVKVNEHTNYNNASYLRALARNYITQHRFKEALSFLKQAETNGERLTSTQKMLFDVHLELGNDKEASKYLKIVENRNDFDYLIRLSKWNDHKGDLDIAIQLMEKALKKAEASKNKNLIQWSYTNLADFYGHANRIEESYNLYLKALELNPNDAYAKKGISWIVYSHERNPDEALRILNTVTNNYESPDYYLLKAEITEYMNDEKAKSDNLQQYLLAVDNKDYGVMYDSYNALIFMEELKSNEEAFKIAKNEISERPTPQSYDLLAWAHFNNGEFQKALDIVTNNILNKTHEPEAQYHMAEIYKANGRQDIANKFKKDLLNSAYELGPVMEQKIKQL